MIDLCDLLLKTVLPLLVSHPMIFERFEVLLLLMIDMSGLLLPVKFAMLQSPMIVVFDLFLPRSRKMFPHVWLQIGVQPGRLCRL